MIKKFVFMLIKSVFVGAFVALVVVFYILFKDFMNKELNSHVVDELTADPAFRVIKLSKAKIFLNEHTIKDKKDLKVTLITKKEIIDKDKHKIKLIIDTNTHNRYFNDKEFFDISSSIISDSLCSRYKEYLSKYSITAYVKNLVFSKKIALDKQKCDNLDRKLLKTIQKDFDITVLSTLPDSEFLLKTSKELSLTDNYIPKTVFKGIKQIYKNANYTVLKDFDDRVFVFKGKKLLTLINLDMRKKDIKSGFLIKDDALYYTDSHLHKLNLKTLQNQIARYSIPISYSITLHQNKLWVMGDKKENSCYPSAKDLSYLYVPTYDYEKDFLFDEDLKLVRVQKHRKRKSKKERIDINSFSLYYAPSKKLVVSKNYFAYKVITNDRIMLKVYKDFKLLENIQIPFIDQWNKSDFDIYKNTFVYFKLGNIVFQDLNSLKQTSKVAFCNDIYDLAYYDGILYRRCKNKTVIYDFKTKKTSKLPPNRYAIKPWDEIRKYNKIEVNMLLSFALSEANEDEKIAFDNNDTIKLNQNTLSLITKDYNKNFYINKKEA